MTPASRRRKSAASLYAGFVAMCLSSASSRAAAPGMLNIVFDGDSISQGYGASAGNTPDQQLQRLSKRPVLVSDVAVAGRPVFRSRDLYPNVVAPLYRRDAINLIAFHGGDNDVALGRSPAQTYDAFTRYVALAHAQGWRVIVSTELQRTGWKPAWQAELSDYNRLLLLNRAGADGVIDLAGAPGLGDAAARRNPADFFRDGIHLSDSGYGLLARMILGAVDRLD